MKTLVIYFSWENQTAPLAEQIAQEQGADIFQIEAVDAYPTDRHMLCQRVMREQDENTRPAFVSPADLESYDKIYVGAPIWFWHIPAVVANFLEQHDFSGKEVIPFCTCLYEGEKRVINEIIDYTNKKGNGQQEKHRLSVRPVSHTDGGYWYIGE